MGYNITTHLTFIFYWRKPVNKRQWFFSFFSFFSIPQVEIIKSTFSSNSKYNAMQCNVMQCNVMQYNAMLCNAMHVTCYMSHITHITCHKYQVTNNFAKHPVCHIFFESSCKIQFNCHDLHVRCHKYEVVKNL